ncbi:glycopeptide antibiotics resistance protein [Paenibacillus endophyticus]|uniref:Glycopeptide antibiotics resistance protein n=1 Tax=Paenibacillus endophyticus TaxID=1294268 RepID=A0A7W5GAT6_9BACL|nr:VanZ family protein [Paenibacillus endophyticus]MBB3152633.1 glycopeptide antibiotics resistance protein [Paenibacillus endophyticus]
MRLYPKAYSRSVLLNLFLTALACGYVLVMCWLLFYRNRYFGEGYSYNLVPFYTIKKYIIYHDHFNFDTWFKNLFGNIILFIPIGVFLPLLNRRYSSGFALAAASIIIITAVELMQMLLRVGSFDIDDIILNTFGALLGLLITKLLIHAS